MSFVVYWSANADESGVLRYTVEYSAATDSEWQDDWLPATTETSGVFTAPVAETEYAFRVTAYDRAGSSARAQTVAYVESQRAYLPVLNNRWRDWYRLDAYEPNDTPEDAYGPVKIGNTYRAPIWDESDVDDYYWFTRADNAKIAIGLSDIPEGTDYDLYIYYYNFDGTQYKYVIADDGRAYSNLSGQQEEEVIFRPVPGRKYWIRVNPFRIGESAPPNNYSPQPYRLTIDYAN